MNFLRLKIYFFVFSLGYRKKDVSLHDKISNYFINLYN